MARNRLKGFTLIELLVGIAILSILFSLSIATFKDFRENQQVVQARETLITDLRFAQSQALGGVKGAMCASQSPSVDLVGWYVKQIGNNAYGIYTRCVGQSAELYRHVLLSPDMTLKIGYNVAILFQPINKDVLFGNADSDPPTTMFPSATIVITKADKTQTIVVGKTGDIK